MAMLPKNKRRLRKNRKARLARGGPSKKPYARKAYMVRPRRPARAPRRTTQHLHFPLSESSITVTRRKSPQVKMMQAVSAPTTAVYNR